MTNPPDAVSGAATPAQQDAKELFPGANDLKAPTGMENLRDSAPIVYEGNMAFAQFIGVIEEAATTPEAQIPECVHAPDPPEREGYWKWVIGGPYQGAVLRGGEIRHLHSSVVKEVFEQARGTKVADVLAGLMFSIDIAEERSRLAFEELNRSGDELATARTESAALRVERDRALEALRNLHTAVWKNCGKVRLLRMIDEIETAKSIIDAARPIPAEIGEGK